MPDSCPAIRIYDCNFTPSAAEYCATDDIFHYLVHVRRLEPHERFSVFNGRDDEYEIIPSQWDKKKLVGIIGKTVRPFIQLPPIFLACAIIKRKPLEFLIQKATELGIRHFTPLITDYTNQPDRGTERLDKIAVEAVEQCRLTSLPTFSDKKRLREWVESLPDNAAIIFCDEGQKQTPPPLRTILLDHKDKYQEWHILIGPEGGFSDTERSFLYHSSSVYAVNLGPRIMRAETAAIAALSVLQSICGDWK